MTTILITGASSGIGQALALHYAKHDPSCRLLLTGRNQERLDETETLCREYGAKKTHTHVIDVRDQAKLASWIAEQDEFSPIDLVIANAGISGGTAGHETGEPISQIREIFSVNIDGVLNTLDPLLERMIQRQSGQIGIISSLAGFSGWAGAPAYSASKACVRVLAEAMHVSLAPHGVKVSAICPGFIKTPMTDVNEYAMPFMISAEKAAEFIAGGLAKNKSRIAFPWQTYAFSGLIGLLPPIFLNMIMKSVPEKK